MVQTLYFRPYAPFVAALLSVLAACGRTPAPDPGVEVAIAPLGLEGVGDAIWDLRVKNGDAQVVWERRITSGRYGDGAGSLTYVGPCDADRPAHTVELWLVGAYADPVSAASAGTFASGSATNVTATALALVNPTLTGPLVAQTTCVPNADARVDFDVTVMRPAEQGFFDIAVSFEDVFCSAKFDCCYDDNGDGCAPDGSEDINLLFTDTGTRARTMVLGFACAAPVSAGEQAELYLDALELDCDINSDTTTFVADVTIDPTRQGNLCVAGQVDTCDSVNTGLNVDADDFLFQAASYQTYEVTQSAEAWETVSWNLALGVNPAIAGCRLRTRGTYDDAANVNDHAQGGRVRAGAIYPYIQWDVELDTCGSEPLVFAPTGPVTTRYSEADESLAFGYHFGEGIAAGPFCDPACQHGGACENGACDCEGTGYTGATCDEPICGPGLVYDNGNCVSPDTTPPSAPLLTSHVSPYDGSDNTLSLSGTCEAGATVALTLSPDTTYAGCPTGTFTFVLSPSGDGTFAYSLTQADAAGNVSAATPFVWTRDTTAPGDPVVATPMSASTSNDEVLAIEGTCEAGTTIELGGDGSESVTCDGTFAFSFDPGADGVYALTVRAVDAAGNASGEVALSWLRDTEAPVAPEVSNHVSPLASNDSNLTLQGPCEDGATVQLGGDVIDSTTCGAGEYTFVISTLGDGVYYLNLTQLDAAGNASNSTDFSWERDTVAPDQPVVYTPSSRHEVSNAATFTITGACETGTTMVLTGDDDLQTPCVAGEYAFTISESTETTFTYTLFNRDGAGNISSDLAVTWLRDTTAPAGPTVTSHTSPHLSPTNVLLITVSCESDTMVDIGGDFVESRLCVLGEVMFNLAPSADGTYTYTLEQTDPAGNTSSTSTFEWTRDQQAPAIPTVTHPATEPYYSSASSLQLEGTCEDGSTVVLSGAVFGTVPCTGGTFSTEVPASGDGTYFTTLAARDDAMNLSGTHAVTWFRDATPPAAPTITTPESSPTLSNASTFMIAGTCEDDLPVHLTGAANDIQPCNDSTYAFVIDQTTDGGYTYTVHQEDLAGNIGESTSTVWDRDATPPSEVVLTSPNPNPFSSGGDAVVVAGSCESGATLVVTGDETSELLCENGAFAFDVNRSTNGTINFAVAQRDDANNTSNPVAVQWTRDDVVPGAVVLTSPTPNPHITSGNSLTIAGSCEGGNAVELTGSASDTTTCAGQAFSFEVTSGVDGTFGYTVRQVGAVNGFPSEPVTVTWTRDTATPNTPTITQPSTNPYASGDSEFVLSGDCEPGATVMLTGATTASTTCAVDGTFAFSLDSTVDGTFEYAIQQQDDALNTSGTLGFQWTRDTNIAASPTIDAPGTSPFYSASTPLFISGTCTTGYTVFLQGSSTQSQTCVGSEYEFIDAKSVDGIYPYSVYQQNPNNLSESTVATLTWHLDRVAPDEVTVTSPPSNPYFSGDDTITVAGACEVGATVDVSGSETLTLPCTTGSYSFPVTRLSNATYNFNIVQTDKAGNASLNYLFQWVRDATIPATPVLQSPAASPFYSSASSLTLSGTCQTGFRVDLTGSSTQNMICANSAFSFSVPGASDATRTYAIKQTNTLTQLVSSETSMTWVRDATAPALVVITQPSTNPYTSGDTLFALNGTCETNTTVALSGAQASSQSCANGTFTFNLSKSVDGTYNYTLIQTDRANNVSGSRSFQWVRNTAIPPTPVLSSPSPNPLTSNATTINVAGSCAGTNTVNISGSHIASTTCNAGSFSFAVTKSTDGTYNFSVTQTSSVNGSVSSAASAQWTRDTVAPSAPVLTSITPQSPAAAANPKVIGTASGATTVQLYKTSNCSGAIAATGPVATFTTTGIAFAATQQATNALSAKSLDAANNASACSNSLSHVHRSARLVADLNTTGSGDSNPVNFGVVGSKVYFRATNGVLGNELWVTDGTLAGTTMVKDINVADSSNPYAFLDLDGTVALFAADDGENGMELWRTDGTENGTYMLVDINEGGGHSSPNNFLKASASVIYFTANHDDYGIELWKTDGTDEGTVLVADLEPGAGSSSPGNLRLVGTSPGIVFTATTTAHGLDLWKSDGTTAGTSCFDINPGAATGVASHFVNFNGYVYFNGIENHAGRNIGAELYRTNGTTAELVQDIRVGTSSGSPGYFAVAGTTLFMYARTNSTTSYELYKIGTTGTVSLVKDINPASGQTGEPVGLTAISSTKIIFRAIDATTGREPWVSDGTEAGTFRLADINPGSTDSGMPTTASIVVNGKAYFYATSDGETELYETDGTVEGTVKRDVNPGAQSSGPVGLTAFGTKLIFSGYTNGEGREPRIVSGGTLSMLRDLNSQTSSLPGSFAQLGTGNTLIFAAQDPTYGRELWKTDGTLAGTVLLKDINTTAQGVSSNPVSLVAVGPNHVFFRADDGINGLELWRTDGTTAGTVLVTDIFPGIDPSTPNIITALNSTTILFSAMDSVSNGVELWSATTTSSPASPAVLVKNIQTVANTSSSPQSFVLMSGKLYFQASDTTFGRELFVSDGTTVGTTLVKDIRSDGHATPASLTLVGTDKLFFSATETATGSELYVTDGTSAGTVRLTDIAAGMLNASPSGFRALGNNLIFSAYTPSTGRELYVSDGTSGGTTLLKDIRVGGGNSNPSTPVVVGTKAVFQAGDDAGGIEIWITDGTPGGTVRLADVRPGTANSNSGAFVAIDTSNLWFIGNEGVNGSEPWRSNTTTAGTYLIQDINTLGPSWGGSALSINGVVYFTATDGINGVELWKY